MYRRLLRKLPISCLMLLSACGLARGAPDPISDAEIRAIYQTPLPRADAPMNVFFIGHSLFGHNMPALLDQIAGPGHNYAIQMGWGVELEAHWEPDVPINGFKEENAHRWFRPAHEAVASGRYDAIILTEKVNILSSIKYHDSWWYLAQWAKKAWAADPDTRVYFYETWHGLDVPEGWLERIDQDLPRYWEGEILDRTLAEEGVDQPIYVIPGGQVFARFVREIEGGSGVGGLTSRRDLFFDDIHFNDLGGYLMALTHYAVIYGRSPVGLPHRLVRVDGKPANAPTPAAALRMQEIVWEVVTGYPRTGVRQR